MEVTVPEKRTSYRKNVEIHKFIYLGAFLENKGTEYTKKWFTGKGTESL
jgi:hypothetical protein